MYGFLDSQEHDQEIEGKFEKVRKSNRKNKGKKRDFDTINDIEPKKRRSSVIRSEGSSSKSIQKQWKIYLIK